ncbi:MAG: gluconolactonase [Planctomycetes bacterium]|nr:gluconolactonase [Planctomycetota bacterium]
MIRFRFLVVLGFAASVAAQSDLVAANAKVKKLASGFRFTEGPAVDAAGNVFFTDIPNNRIHRWSLDGKLTTFREDSGGANGLYFDAKGRLLACEGGRRRLVRITMKGETQTLAATYEKKPFNSPNDLWTDPKGAVWFTDPRYGQQKDLQQGGFHVYRLAPDGKTVNRVASDLVKPNGILGTKDGKTLYVADAGGRKIYRYAIEGAALSKKTLFVPDGGSDGMTLDEKGNLYLTQDAVVVYAPSGKRVARIDIPERPANVCFGGKDRRTLFVTARKSLYSLRMRVRGL